MLKLTRGEVSKFTFLILLTMLFVYVTMLFVNVKAEEDPSLIISYDMQQEGNNITDFSGNNNTGIVENNVARVQGPYDYVRKFTSNSTTSCGRIKIAASPSINNVNTKTYEMWVCINSNTSGGLLGRSVDYWVTQDSTNGLRYRVPFVEANGTVTTDVWKAGTTIPLGQYVHLVIVHDTSASRIAPKFYINGVETSATWDTTQSNKTSAAGLPPSDDSNYPLYIGAKKNSSGSAAPDRSVDAQIGRFKLYNRALSADEVMQHYNNEKWFYDDTDNTVRSDVYQVDNSRISISGIPCGVTADQLIGGLKKKAAATVLICQKDGSVRNGEIKEGDRLIVSKTDTGERLYTYSIELNPAIEVTAARLWDVNSSKIADSNSLGNQNTVRAEFQISNTATLPQKTTIIMILYENNILQKMIVKGREIAPNEQNVPISAEMNFDSSNEGVRRQLKVFLWDDIKNGNQWYDGSDLDISKGV